MVCVRVRARNMRVGTPVMYNGQIQTTFFRENNISKTLDIAMSQVPIIRHTHSDETRIKEMEEHRKRIEEEAKKEEENVNPDDVHPVLWTIYNVATVAQPILFLFYLGIMAFVVRGLVVNPGTFAFNDVLTSALIEGKLLISLNAIRL